jgi:hypothetical protein
MRQAEFPNAPWWFGPLSLGAFDVALISVGAHDAPLNHASRPGDWTQAVITGLMIGVSLGAAMPFHTRTGRGSTVAGDLPARDLRAARRAAWRGPVPQDPVIRRAAAQLASYTDHELSQFRWVGIAFAVLTAASVSFALTLSPFWCTASAVSAIFAAMYLTWPRRLHRRLETLGQVTQDQGVPPTLEATT